MRLFYGDRNEFVHGLTEDYLVARGTAEEFADRYLGIEGRLKDVASYINANSHGATATPDRVVSSTGLLDVLHHGLADHMPEDALWAVQDIPWAYQACFGRPDLEELPPEYREALGPSNDERFLQRITGIFDRVSKDDTHHLYHAVVDDVADHARAAFPDPAVTERFRREEHAGYYPRWTDASLVADTLVGVTKDLELQYFHPVTLTRNVMAAGKQHDATYRRRIAGLWADLSGAQSPQGALAAAERRVARKNDQFFDTLGVGGREVGGRAEDNLYVMVALRDIIAAEQAFLQTYLER